MVNSTSFYIEQIFSGSVGHKIDEFWYKTSNNIHDVINV